MNASTNKSLLLALAAAAVGAASMYWLDPRLGKQRRRIAQDRAGAVVRSSGRAFRTRLGSAAVRLMHRIQGRLTQAREHWRRNDLPSDDDTVRDRVQSRLGHLLQRQGRIQVNVRNGCAMLRGAAPSRILKRVVRATRAVPGVVDVNVRRVRREHG